jgi:phosphatidylinositol kinase/protein kinase (PI-3  family)
MSLLRRNKDCLMSVLDAFIHDPLVEWEDEKKRMVGLSALSGIETQKLCIAGKTSEVSSPEKERPCRLFERFEG